MRRHGQQLRPVRSSRRATGLGRVPQRRVIARRDIKAPQGTGLQASQSVYWSCRLSQNIGSTASPSSRPFGVRSRIW
jgi:hypothetical protein